VTTLVHVGSPPRFSAYNTPTMYPRNPPAMMCGRMTWMSLMVFKGIRFVDFFLIVITVSRIMSFDTVKAYLDLTRIHFFLVWPLLFCSGLFLSFPGYGGFSWELVCKSVFIALFGFEAGFVLNDVVDAELDRLDVEQGLTRYWRPFGSRPIPSGAVSLRQALALFLVLVAAASVLIFTLPYPNSVYVWGIMVLSYALEYFYQTRKRDQSLPFAQLIGRIDFSLFPVAGYLVNGSLDVNAVFYFLFFYPFAQAHLGLNDIIDYGNDLARGLKTIPVIYGVKDTKYWISCFCALHLIVAYQFFRYIGGVMGYLFYLGLVLLLVVNLLVWRGETLGEWLRALPLFHLTLLLYLVSMVANYFI
jgi:4-hydroxybenzoate polyprenyltransferase